MKRLLIHALIASCVFIAAWVLGAHILIVALAGACFWFTWAIALSEWVSTW